MHILSELLALLGKIPVTFWGVVAGSFFTLIGITLTNRANDRRLQAQLSHEREPRKQERELSLRKAVYLAAVEAIVTERRALERLAEIDIPIHKLLKSYNETPPSIRKLPVIAGEKTVKAVVHFTSELDAAYLQVLAKRIPFEAQRNQCTFLNQELTR
jgi:hypothetical protein